jgi:hypothetical protein
MKANFRTSSVLLLLLSAISARAVDLDLSGKVFKPKAHVVVTSTGKVPNSLIYQINLSGSGTSTGSFISLFGNGDFATGLAAIDPGALSLLQFTLANPTGKFPAVLGAQEGVTGVADIAIATGTMGSVSSRAHVSIKLNKNGTVTAGITGISIRETTNAGKRLAVTGDYSLTSGMLSVNPLPATSGTAEPGVIALFNTHYCLMAGAYSEVSPGNGVDVFVRPGGNETRFFIMQNNGPSVDNFVLKADAFPTGVTAQFFDGKTDITSQVTGSGGYAISNFPSAGLKLIKVKVNVGRSTPKSQQFHNSGTVAFRLARATDSTVFAYGGVTVFVK